jgi:hypothetical protein
MVSWETIDSEGSRDLRFGERPIGWLRYESDGRMAVQIMGSDRTEFASGEPRGVTAEEVRGALLSYVAYFGAYEVDEKEGSVTHISEGNTRPNVVGVRQKRMVELAGDRLTLRIASPPAGMRESALVWERV